MDQVSPSLEGQQEGREGESNEREVFSADPNFVSFLSQRWRRIHSRILDSFLSLYVSLFPRLSLRSNALPSASTSPNSPPSFPSVELKSSPTCRLSLLLTPSVVFLVPYSLQPDTRYLRPSSGYETNAGRGSSTHHHRRKQVRPGTNRSRGVGGQRSTTSVRSWRRCFL